MYKTFKEFLMENANGNYVCIDVEDDLSSYFNSVGLQEPITGTAPPQRDYHCTLIYSKTTYTDPNKIMKAISEKFDPICHARIEGFDCFDSLPENGVRDSAKSCIVMKLDCPVLHEIYRFLQSLGLQHSYPQYSPHVTLRYNMSVEEAHYYKDLLNTVFLEQVLTLKNFKSQTINKNYV